jgi:hypothetical protein
MKRYSSFLVRCWLIDDQVEEKRSVIDVEHIQTGGRFRVARIVEAEQWMFEACRQGNSGSIELDNEGSTNCQSTES